MRRLVCGFICAAVMLCGLSCPVSGIDTGAASAILVDAASGRVLYRHNADDIRYIASITKLMTALVVMESGVRLDDTVTVLPEYTGAEGSSMYLRAGETLTVETLMYGLLLASGNDAAVALAYCCAGSVEAFVDQMNRKAAQLGMTGTHFVNPSGLTQEGHCSTATDMSILAAACMRNDTIAKIVSTKSITIGDRSFTNHNKLLWRYEGCIGMKTGYTERSGRTLISCAQRDGQQLIAVTLDDPNDWADHTALLDYGFATYRNQTLISQGTVVARVPVKGSLIPFANITAQCTVCYPLTSSEEVRSEITLNQTAHTPIRKGQTAGTMTFYSGEQVVGMCPLVFDNTVASNLSDGNFLQKLYRRLTA